VSLSYEHLLGKSFELGKQDCFTLFRDFYRDNFQIELPNYARPENFWEVGMDIYLTKAAKNGFRILDCHPTEYQAGDVVLMAIHSTHANHAGILLEDGSLIHHLFGRLSTKEPYRGVYRNTTIAVCRHKDVVIEEVPNLAHIDEYLTPKAKRFLDELRRNPSGSRPDGDE
jgi:cell wall-associated NlpC family hydrolase